MTLQLDKMSAPKNKFPRLPEGTYVGRIAGLIDLGIQPQTDWKSGEPTDSKPRVLLTCELPTELLEFKTGDDEVEMKPRWISKEFTLSSFDQSNLVKLINALAPGTKDLKELLNLPCMVTVGSTVNGNAKIVSLVSSPSGMPVGELANEATYFDFDDPNEDLFKSQPEWLRTKITEAENYTGFADDWTVGE
jgi:hypothetical protein